MGKTPKDHDRVELIERATPFRGYFRVDRYRLRHRKFDGGWTPAVTREVFERGHAAAVLPYDAARDRVVMIEQFRIGAYAAGVAPWLIEVVAGIIEPGETAEAVVRREAVEEAGIALGALRAIGTFLMTPGGSSETLALYCGLADSAGAGGIHGLEHEGEDIRVFAATPEEAYARTMAQPCPHAVTTIALQWLLLNRAELRGSWGAA